MLENFYRGTFALPALVGCELSEFAAVLLHLLLHHYQDYSAGVDSCPFRQVRQFMVSPGEFDCRLTGHMGRPDGVTVGDRGVESRSVVERIIVLDPSSHANSKWSKPLNERIGRPSRAAGVEHDECGRLISGLACRSECTCGDHGTRVEVIYVVLERNELLVAVPREMHYVRAKSCDSFLQVLSGRRQPHLNLHLITMQGSLDCSADPRVFPSDSKIAFRGSTQHEDAEFFDLWCAQGPQRRLHLRIGRGDARSRQRPSSPHRSVYAAWTPTDDGRTDCS